MNSRTMRPYHYLCVCLLPEALKIRILGRPIIQVLSTIRNWTLRNWTLRLNIAIDISHALAYLHHYNGKVKINLSKLQFLIHTRRFDQFTL